MKKAFKAIGIILAILIVILLISPFIFKGSLEKMLKRTINENINATVAWESLDLSLLRSFPDASLQLENFSITNKAPFEGDTLARGESLKLDMGILQLFKSKNLKIDALTLDGAFVNIKIDSLGNANYDVALKNDAPIKPDQPDSNDGFTFELSNYEINDSRITYADESNKTRLLLTNVQHSGSGDLSQDISELDTQTSALVTFDMDGTEYLTRNKIALDALFKLNLEDLRITFLENEAKINDLPLTFDGYVQVNENNNEMDISFKTPSSDFKNFLAVIPETYVKQISNVKTTGEFVVDGMIKGIVDSTHIPMLDIKITSENASFKYPDLPKTVDNITIDAQLKNETGLVEDTFLDIPRLKFRIDGNPFKMKIGVRNMTTNPLVALEMQGILDLAHIKEVLPVEIEQDLSGIFQADIATNFDMESVEKERFEKIDAHGTAKLSDFKYDAGFKSDIEVSTANLAVNSGRFMLEELHANTGQTDISASGTIRNLIPFLTSDQDLKGRFDVKSNTFDVNDFMVPQEEAPAKGDNKLKTNVKEAIKIPDFLDATLDFNANTVVYDNLNLKNAKGTATIQDETIAIRNFTSNIFDGNIALSGEVSTKSEVPTFAMNLDLSQIDIDKSFEELEMFQFLVPIAKALQGSLTTKFDLTGQLTHDLSPNLSTLGGTALAEIITAEVNPDQAPLLSAISDKLSFLDLNKLGLQDVSTKLVFNDGRIEVQPFHFDIKGIDIAVAGSHGLDKSMDYDVTMVVPAKYLGTDVNNLLQKLNREEAEKMNVSLPMGIQGTFANPRLSLNTQEAITQLTQEILAKEKDKWKDKGKDILDDFLDRNTKKDTTTIQEEEPAQEDQQQEDTRPKNTEIIKDIFDGIMGGRKKRTDTTQNAN